MVRMSSRAARTLMGECQRQHHQCGRFVVQPNGARLRFDRTSAGPFSLDIGTVEGLIVNGIGGDDTFTVNDLARVASLTTVNLNGLSDNDVFSLSPSTSTVNVNTVGGINTGPATP